MGDFCCLPNMVNGYEFAVSYQSWSSQMHYQTKAIHNNKVTLIEGNCSLVSPVHHSVKYIPRSTAHLKQILSDRKQGYLYSRVANPTVCELENLLAGLQGREAAICVSTGIAAISAVVIALLKSGDHVLMFRESYKPTRFLMKGLMSKFGVRTTVFGIDDRTEVENLFKADPPTMVLIESPTNPIVRVPDLEWITKLCKTSGALSVLDNTFAGFHHHGALPIDIYVHSLTKHACGHSDAMGGVVISSNENIEKIFPAAVTLGATLDPNAAWLILRGLKTYSLRTREASMNTKMIFEWLKTRLEIANLRFPGDPTHKDYHVWKKQMNGDGGTIIAFDLKGPPGTADKFIDSLKLFSLTPSMGCVESLVALCLPLFADDFSTEDALKAGITPNTVRLAIGIEASSDLIEDLNQAFTKIL
jgi:cystathionine beta-lyase/cystathionine gamma-synthase